MFILFFGRNISRIHNFTKGEIVSDLRNRYQGYRIKFKINNNQVKMYDKGNNLRIEVTINNPKDFKILKEKEVIIEHQKLEAVKQWVPMGKSIANLYRYVEISKSITKRYIDALPEINTNVTHVDELKEISSKKVIENRNYSGFNILNSETLEIFKVISNDKYLINGFTNKKIRKEIFDDDSESKYIQNKTTRLLAKLKAHGIIKKISKKNKYYLTTKGRRIINTILLFTNKELLS